MQGRRMLTEGRQQSPQAAPAILSAADPALLGSGPGGAWSAQGRDVQAHLG